MRQRPATRCLLSERNPPLRWSLRPPLDERRAVLQDCGMAVSGEWCKRGAIYQIYPRSFQDSNGDGIGDLGGIASRLGHLVDLGADAVWLSPIFASPMADFGYDISDFRAIDP